MDPVLVTQTLWLTKSVQSTSQKGCSGSTEVCRRGAAHLLLPINYALNGLKLISTNEMTPTGVPDQYNISWHTKASALSLHLKHDSVFLPHCTLSVSPAIPFNLGAPDDYDIS
jgi:hypothetical protein